MPSTRP